MEEVGRPQRVVLDGGSVVDGRARRARTTDQIPLERHPSRSDEVLLPDGVAKTHGVGHLRLLPATGVQYVVFVSNAVGADGLHEDHVGVEEDHHALRHRGHRILNPVVHAEWLVVVWEILAPLIQAKSRRDMQVVVGVGAAAHHREVSVVRTVGHNPCYVPLLPHHQGRVRQSHGLPILIPATIRREDNVDVIISQTRHRCGQCSQDAEYPWRAQRIDRNHANW
mmetsp:Transcript_16943/g.32118  ORF Transcript_16943/g.32118 Transcript_16943/m.32118 type:complete len:224 (-) Transcript_16943:72-743(-)